MRSKSVGGGKYELKYNEEKWKDVQQHLKEHCSLKLHLSTHRPRGKTRRRALCLCAHRLRKKKEDNHPKFSGPEGQKVHEKSNPDEVLFSGRSTVLATKLGERLSAHRKEVQSAHCEARVKSLVDEAKKLGWMPASLLSTLKGTGDTSATEAAAASPNDEGLGGADTSVVCATSSDIDEQVKVALSASTLLFGWPTMTCSVLLVPMQPSPNQCQSEKKSRRMKECGSAPWLSRIGGDAATQLARMKTGNKLQLPRVGKLRTITVMPSQPVVLSFTSGEFSSTKALLMASAIPSAERRFVEGRHART